MRTEAARLIVMAVSACAPVAVTAQTTPGDDPAGWLDLPPDATGARTRLRHFARFEGERSAPQIGMSVEIADAAHGPASAAGISTAATASYALSLVDVRPDWASSDIAGEADGLSVFVRQSRGDTAAILSNVAVRNGYAATLESVTFAADGHKQPQRAVRTQLGVVNARDGGEYGLVLQAEQGDKLSAGIRVAATRAGTWSRYFEAIDSDGRTVAAISGKDGAVESDSFAPWQDFSGSLGTPGRRFATTYSAVVALSAAPFASLPACHGGQGAGTIAYVGDARDAAQRWHQAVTSGGGHQRIYVQCDGTQWLAF